MPQADKLHLMTLDESLAASELNYSRLLGWNDRLDNKIHLVLSIATAMLGGAGLLIENSLAYMDSVLFWLVAALMLCPVAGVMFHIASATSPRLDPPPVALKHQPQASLLFFATTASGRYCTVQVN